MKAIKVLKALAYGQEVEINGRTYGMEEGNLIMKGTSWPNGQKPFVDEGETIWLCADMPLSAFTSMCEKVNDDDLFILAAERALTEINRGK